MCIAKVLLWAGLSEEKRLYLSGIWKIPKSILNHKNTQQHIHNYLIEKAKEKLSTTNLSVSEIAYELGFEHPQSFNKLLKAKLNYLH